MSQEIKLKGNGFFITTTPELRSIQRYFKTVEKYPVLSAKEEMDLLVKYYNTRDIEIRNYLVCCNQRFVYAAAKNYTLDPNLMMDLVTEGNLALIKSIEEYNPDFNTRLMTYAKDRIRRDMNLYLARTNIVRRDSDWKIGKRLNDERESFFHKNYRYPTNDELREIMKEKYGINHISDSALEIPVFASIDDHSYSNTHCEFDDDVSDVDVSEAIGIEACEYNEYESQIENDDVKATVIAAMGVLSERDQDILKMLYGIDYPEDIDPDEIAAKHGITRTRVFQINREALAKMKYAVSA